MASRIIKSNGSLILSSLIIQVRYLPVLALLPWNSLLFSSLWQDSPESPVSCLRDLSLLPSAFLLPIFKFCSSKRFWNFLSFLYRFSQPYSLCATSWFSLPSTFSKSLRTSSRDCLFIYWPCSMWDLRPPVRNWTHTPSIVGMGS